MFDFLDDIKNYGNVTAVILSILAIFMSGIFLASTYFVMSVTETAFHSMDCTIQNNVYVGSCQELWSLSVYPFFALKDILVWFNYFFIFALVIGMLVLGYQSGKSPALMGVLVLMVGIITYIGIELSNIYRTMLEVDVFRQMMISFPVYNQIMLGFPRFTFFVGLFSLLLGVVNFQKTRVNSFEKDELNY